MFSDLVLNVDPHPSSGSQIVVLTPLYASCGGTNLIASFSSKEQIFFHFCNPDIEMLAVSFHPYYLPREFTSSIMVAVSIPPSAGANAACDIISSFVA